MKARMSGATNWEGVAKRIYNVEVGQEKKKHINVNTHPDIKYGTGTSQIRRGTKNDRGYLKNDTRTTGDISKTTGFGGVKVENGLNISIQDDKVQIGLAGISILPSVGGVEGGDSKCSGSLRWWHAEVRLCNTPAKWGWIFREGGKDNFPLSRNQTRYSKGMAPSVE